MIAGMDRYRYKLQVRLNIQREEDRNYGVDPASGLGPQWVWTQDRLEIAEDLDLGSLDFVGLLQVLAKLHDSVGEISGDRSG